jgi:predicted acyl esterase
MTHELRNERPKVSGITASLARRRGESQLTPVFKRPAAEGVAVEYDVEIVARDGTVLRVDIYHPLDWNEHHCPALLAVGGYQKATAGLPAVATYPFCETGPIEWYVRRGYVYVLADARGTGTSEGAWNFFGPQEQHDLYDMIEWIAGQAWCTRKVGMIGRSYYGLVQWLAAAQQPPHLTCIAPCDALVDNYRDHVFHGGIACNFTTHWDTVLRANHVWGPHSGRGLRFRTSPFEAMLAHPTEDEFWRERTAFRQLPEVRIPVMSVGDWGKNSLHVRGNILGYERVSGVKRLRMEAAARPQSMPGAKALRDFGSPEFHERMLAPWYDYWLRGIDNGVLDDPAVSLYVSGADEERHFDEWPPREATDVSFYLAGGSGRPRHSLNDGLLREYTDIAEDGARESCYQYPDPQWHLGTATVTSLGIPNPVARILTFSTPPLEVDLEVIGCARLELYGSSDQPDTDFIVRVADEGPRPNTLHPELPTPAVTVSKGWLRASHRQLDEQLSTERRPYHTHTDPEPLTPGHIYRFDIELMPMAHVFKAGHRVRLEIANGDSAVTEGLFSHYYTPKAGTDTIHHDFQFPSCLVLPVLKHPSRGRNMNIGA